MNCWRKKMTRNLSYSMHHWNYLKNLMMMKSYLSLVQRRMSAPMRMVVKSCLKKLMTSWNLD